MVITSLIPYPFSPRFGERRGILIPPEREKRGVLFPSQFRGGVRGEVAYCIIKFWFLYCGGWHDSPV